MASKSFVASQPVKLLYTIWAISLNAARLPFWMIYFIPSFLRQNPKWSWNQALKVRILKGFLRYVSVTQAGTPTILEPGKEAEKFITISPGKPDKYIGVVAQDAEIFPVKIGATWYPSRRSSASTGNVVLHFHGGAYVIGDGRTQDAGFATKTILENAQVTHVLCPQYRLASNPGGRFPAFLQDGITSLLYLTETLNIPAEKIIISGDSAGGHLCLALLRYIHDNPDAKLRNPACAWLWSPWVNPGSALIPGSYGLSPHESTDYLDEGFGSWGAKAITPSRASGITLEHPNICILGNAFATPTPLHFSVGECEMLYHDDLKTYEEFKAISGNKVDLHIQKGAVHDIILIGNIVGMEKEAAFAAKKAGEFLRTCK
jgi:acetyl esterase/lipase